MPTIDESKREIVVKIVYQGPGLAGRASNRQYVYNKTRPEARGSYEVLATETATDLGGNIVTVATIVACDILPPSVAPIRGCRLRVRLFGTPSALHVEGLEEQVLQGADGVIFVADSQRVRLEAAIETMAALTIYVARQGRVLASVPLALQYNKRDLPDIVPVAELDAVLNPDRRPFFEAVAPTGLGVFETLRAVVKPIVDRLRDAP